MKVFKINGVHNSGKTTTLEYIVRDLRYRGYSVASAKDFTDKNFCLDKEGQNTLRHRIAGSEAVIARGIKETGIFFQSHMHVSEMLKYLNFDYFVLEDFENVLVPNIVTARTFEEADLFINDKTLAISGVVANQAEIKEYKGVPLYNGILSSRQLTDLIIEKVQDNSHIMEITDENDNIAQLPVRKKTTLRRKIAEK